MADNTWARITWLRERREAMFEHLRFLREEEKQKSDLQGRVERNYNLWTDACNELTTVFAQRKVTEKGYGSIEELKGLSREEIVNLGLDVNVAIAIGRLANGDDFEDTSSA
jgi:hypothetical protein